MKYALKKARRVIISDTVTGKHRCTITEITKADLTDGQSTVWALGANGVRLAGFDTTKTSTFKFDSGVLSDGVIQLQTGGTKTTVTNGTKIKVRDEFTLSGTPTTVKLTYLASGAVGSEIKWIYKEDSSGEFSDSMSYAQAGTASSTAFSYAAATGIITLPTGIFSAGDIVGIDYYPTFSSYTEIENNSKNFSFTGEVFVDGYWTDLSTQADVALQLYCPAGKVSGAFSFSFGDAVAVQSIEIEALASQKAGQVGQMWVLRNYDLTTATKPS